MISGMDTTFLVEFEVREHSGHGAARALFAEWMRQGERPAVAPQVLAEFIHVITDPRRFERPLSMIEAVQRARLWWDAAEIRRLCPNERSMKLFSEWMSRFNLGRKRILNTMLAATYFPNGVERIVTSNIGTDHSDLHFGAGVFSLGLQNIEWIYSFAPKRTPLPLRSDCKGILGFLTGPRIFAILMYSASSSSSLRIQRRAEISLSPYPPCRFFTNSL